jgi:hypothetical protein
MHCWLGGTLLFACASIQGQRATVVFYNHGSTWTIGIPGAKHSAYAGNIFDGSERLFAFRDGFFQHNTRYLIFSLEPGPHTFGASNAQKPEARELLTVNLEAGHQYFIRAQGETAGVPAVLTIEHGRLDLMSCQDAQDELAKAQPLKDKGLSKYSQSNRAVLFVAGAAPPRCH